MGATRVGAVAGAQRVGRAEAARSRDVNRRPRARWLSRRGEPDPSHLPALRSVERRRWSSELIGSASAGLVVHGMPGIGKSALATEITTRVARLEPERVSAVLRSELSADRFLIAVAGALRGCPLVAGRDQAAITALDAAERLDLPWATRLARLREHVLGQWPVLVVLDDFDDNLTDSSAGPPRDPDLADLLATWAGVPHLGRLLITCREPFGLPGGAQDALAFRGLGPMSRADAAELAATMPALSQLDPADLARAWRLTGGHPGALRYLDALLAASPGQFTDLARRLAAAAGTRGDPPPPDELPADSARAVAAAATGLLLAELLGQLSPEARVLLTGASAYRVPVGADAPLLPAGQAGVLDRLAAECAAAGLLAVDRTAGAFTVFVPRWTAAGLHRQPGPPPGPEPEPARQDAGEVAGAHRRAAGYWRDRAGASPQDQLDARALRESGYHLRRAGDLDRGPRLHPRRAPRAPRARMAGLAAGAAAVAAALAVTVVHLASAVQPSSDAAQSTAAGAGARAAAAAWITGQISASAIVACEPSLCAALRADGHPEATLRPLPPSGSLPRADVLVITADRQSAFGARLPGGTGAVLASFGAGAQAIKVRELATTGAQDVVARKTTGQAVDHNHDVTVSAAARADLLAGRVDSRLMLMLVTMAAYEPVHVVSFDDAGPGASPGMPLRGARITAAGPGGPAGAVALRGMLTFARGQRGDFLAAHAAIETGITGTAVLEVQFAAPSPSGVLQTKPPS